ncbi:MAG: long-chain fatty acid--CoA ligase, partial [Bacteroidales bacterium]|nr:long-chain fatty acid--CoA ligase [Bacteroidales bacterium]
MKKEVSKYRNITELVRDKSLQYHNRTALRYRRDEKWHVLSWTNFINTIDYLSFALLDYRVEKGENIGIFSPNMPEWTIADFSIASLRAVSIPMYATDSKERVKYIVNETEMRILFVGTQYQYDIASELIKECDSLTKIVVFDSKLSLKDDHASVYYKNFINIGKANTYKEELERRLNNSSEDDIATIIYTSGTTGEPKGVIIDNGSLIQTLKIHNQRLDVSDNDVSICFLPLSHVFERTWTYFCLQNAVIINYLQNPKEIVHFIAEVKPTVMCTVPRFFEKTFSEIYSTKESWTTVKQKIFDWAINIGEICFDKKTNNERIKAILKFKFLLADKLVFKTIKNVFGGKIRFMPCSGAKLPYEIKRFFHSVGLFINYGYGLTESLATVSCYKTDVFDLKTEGTPMPKVDIKIGDNNEILVKGKTIFKGYFKKDEETARVFDNGWFKTGDSGTINDNGDLIMLERLKEIIKTSVGKYIPPQKIEAFLEMDKYINQIIVVGNNEKFISALIVPNITALKKLAVELNIEVLSDEDLFDEEDINEYLVK